MCSDTATSVIGLQFGRRDETVHRTELGASHVRQLVNDDTDRDELSPTVDNHRLCRSCLVARLDPVVDEKDAITRLDACPLYAQMMGAASIVRTFSRSLDLRAGIETAPLAYRDKARPELHGNGSAENEPTGLDAGDLRDVTGLERTAKRVHHVAQEGAIAEDRPHVGVTPHEGNGLSKSIPHPASMAVDSTGMCAASVGLRDPCGAFVVAAVLLLR
jgi:hypothetical protein